MHPVGGGLLRKDAVHLHRICHLQIIDALFLRQLSDKAVIRFNARVIIHLVDLEALTGRMDCR